MPPAKKRAQTQADTGVAWTPQLRKKVYVSRAMPEAIVDETWTTGDATSVAMALVNVDPFYMLGPKERDAARKLATKGLASSTKSLATIVQKALDAAAAKKCPPKLDADAEGVAKLYGLRMDAVELGLAKHGVAFALATLLAMARRRVDPKSGALLDDGVHVDRDSGLWQRLREAIATAPDAEVKAARTLATKAWKAATCEIKSAMAYAFGDVALARSASSALLAANNGGMFVAWLMLVATASVEDVVQLAALDYPLEEATGLTLLANHGVAAAPALDALAKTRNAKRKKALAALRKLLS